MKINRVYVTVYYEDGEEELRLVATNPDIDSAIASLGAIERKLAREKVVMNDL